jgi:hypothetical protein
VLQYPPNCYPLHWNFAALGALVFVSEYGAATQPDNPRRIYRSWYNGATRSVAYSPPAQLGLPVSLWIGASPGGKRWGAGRLRVDPDVCLAVTRFRFDVLA